MKLSAVDFIEADIQLQVRIHVQELNDVVAGEEVESGHFTITRAHHSKGLSTAGLSICEAGSLGTLESLRDER